MLLRGHPGDAADSVHRDFRFAWRALLRSPAFTLAAVASLAIGIGATTAVFGLADAVLLRPLPLPEPDRLVEMIATFPDGHQQTNLESVAFDVLRAEGAATADVFAQAVDRVSLRSAGETAVRVDALYVSGNYFRSLGVGALHGRVLQEQDDRAGAQRTAVLSHRFWSSVLGRRPDILGKGVWIEGAPATIVGVAPARFVGVERGLDPQVFIPLSSLSAGRQLWVLGRLRPGVSQEAAEARLGAAYQHAVGFMGDEVAGWPPVERVAFLAQRLQLRPAGHGTVALVWMTAQRLRALAFTVLLVLLIACLNVSALQVARGEGRLAEIALRFSIGAGRWRVVRQLLTESIVLAGLAGAIGLGIGAGLQPLLTRLIPLGEPFVEPRLEWNWRLWTFALGVSSAAALASGLYPAMRLARLDPAVFLKAGRSTSNGWRGGARRTLLVAQVAGAVVLLTASGLLVRSLSKLAGVDPGFRHHDVLLVAVDPSGSPLASEPASRWAVPLAARLAAVPGVRGASYAGRSVFTGRASWNFAAWVTGYEPPAGDRQSVDFNEIGPGLLATVGIPLISGRDFDEHDRAGSPAVAIVNAAFARKYFGRSDVLGRRFGTDRNAPDKYEIVAVAADAKVKSLRDTDRPVAYIPAQQSERSGPMVVHLRTSTSSAAVAAAVQREAARFDPDVTVQVRSLDDELAWTEQPARQMALALTLLAGVALALTVVGLHSTLAYVAERRTAEFGIRFALGATRGDVLLGIVRQSLGIVAAGSALGAACTLALPPLLGRLLYQVGRIDAPAAAAAVIVVSAAGVLASAAPAWRASRIDPAAALRRE